MHIHDGFLSVPIWALLWVASVVIIAYAARKTEDKLGEKHIPLMGVLAAFIFAAQMLNTPVAGGTSGHMLGGVLAAVLLGPLSASLIMASVFCVQAVFFQDGGVTALGANMFNMGFIGTILCYFICSKIRTVIGGRRGMFAGAGIAAWLSVVLASAMASFELSLSGTVALGIVLPAMLLIHAVIGLIEAGITLTVLGSLSQVRPDLLELEKI